MSPILQVFRKEIREIVRDKRVRNAATIMPLFVVALMMSLFGFMGNVVNKDAKRKVHVVTSTSPLLAKLRQSKNLEIVEIPSEEAGVKLIQEGKARLVAVLNPPKNGQEQITLRFDPKEDGAQIAKGAFQAAFAQEIKARLVSTLASAGLDPAKLSPIAFDEKPVQVGEGTGAGGLLVGFLPYLLVLFTFTGGVALAADLVAGEKERSTLETLLIAPVRRTEVVLGKFLALATVCIVAAISGLIGFALSAAMKTPGSELVFKSGLGLTPGGAALTFLILLPLAATFAGVLIAVSSYARNSREAQTYLGMLNLVVMIPAVFSQIIGLTDMASAPWLPFVPILGAAAGIRSILLGKATAIAILGPFGVGVVLATVSILAAIRLFHRENVLLRI
jgi:sodium transport system permease protein